MAARSIASMTLSFGLVSVPVKVYTATESKSGVGFNLMHKECGTRLKQQLATGVLLQPRRRHWRTPFWGCTLPPITKNTFVSTLRIQGRTSPACVAVPAM